MRVVNAEARPSELARIVAPYITQWGSEQDLTPKLVTWPRGGTAMRTNWKATATTTVFCGNR